MEIQWLNHSQNATEEEQKKYAVSASTDNVANRTEEQA